MSKTLDVAVSYFFEDMPDDVDEPGAPPVEEPGVKARREADPMRRRETLALVRSSHRIEDPMVRKQVEEMIKALAKAS